MTPSKVLRRASKWGFVIVGLVVFSLALVLIAGQSSSAHFEAVLFTIIGAMIGLALALVLIIAEEE